MGVLCGALLLSTIIIPTMKTLLIALAFTATAATGFSQQSEAYPATQKELETKILALDKAFFDAFNSCNIEACAAFLTEDLEFYHDKGGMTTTREDMLATTKQNLCSRPGWKMRREPVAVTLKVYPLEGYGAVLTGDHQFYVTENGKEQLTGKAKFTHIWLFKDGTWKMSRIISYDHQPAQ